MADAVNPVWYFRKQGPGDTRRDPISGEFFATESVKDVGGALVREALQNSLDARPDGSDRPAQVRFYLSGLDGALEPGRAKHWFRSLRRHLAAPKNGLRRRPDSNEPCPFLVVEDFDTVGLVGDPNAYTLQEGRQNNFLSFFRAEGQSDKGGGTRGSWGIGKAVFPRASCINTFFGLTVPADRPTERLLMGRSILRFHSVDGVEHVSDGYYGEVQQNDFVRPCSKPAIIDEFCRDFNLSRGAQPGLSVVVPWYTSVGEPADAVSLGSLRDSVIRGFFYAILSGILVVELSSPSNATLRLDRDSIEFEIENGDDSSFRGEMLPVVRLAKWSMDCTPERFVDIGHTTAGMPRWDPALVPGPAAMASALGRGDRLAIRVPLRVTNAGGSSAESRFMVFLDPSPQSRERPLFIREELLICDVRKGTRVPGVRSLVVIKDPTLEDFLRDAENPAHTDWSPRSGNFEGKYLYGKATIDYVATSVSRVVETINSNQKEADRSITARFFPDTLRPPMREQGRPKSPVGGATPEIPKRRPAPFRATPVVGGFRIRVGDAGGAMRGTLEIRVAYDVRKGRALRKYSADDFDLSEAPLNVVVAGAEMKKVAANRLLVADPQGDFELTVTGFDPNRDLLVRTHWTEAAGAD